MSGFFSPIGKWVIEHWGEIEMVLRSRDEAEVEIQSLVREAKRRVERATWAKGLSSEASRDSVSVYRDRWCLSEKQWFHVLVDHVSLHRIFGAKEDERPWVELRWKGVFEKDQRRIVTTAIGLIEPRRFVVHESPDVGDGDEVNMGWRYLEEVGAASLLDGSAADILVDALHEAVDEMDRILAVAMKKP